MTSVVPAISTISQVTRGQTTEDVVGKGGLCSFLSTNKLLKLFFRRSLNGLEDDWVCGEMLRLAFQLSRFSFSCSTSLLERALPSLRTSLELLRWTFALKSADDTDPTLDLCSFFLNSPIHPGLRHSHVNNPEWSPTCEINNPFKT